MRRELHDMIVKDNRDGLNAYESYLLQKLIKEYFQVRYDIYYKSDQERKP